MTTSGDPAPVARWAATGESSLRPSQPAPKPMKPKRHSLNKVSTLCDTIDKAATELNAVQEMASSRHALLHDALHGPIQHLKNAQDQAHRLKFLMRTDKECSMQTRDGGLMTPKLEQMPQSDPLHDALHGAVKDPSQIRRLEVVEGQPLKVPSLPGPTRWDPPVPADERCQLASSSGKRTSKVIDMSEMSDDSWLDGYEDVEVRDREGDGYSTGHTRGEEDVEVRDATPERREEMRVALEELVAVQAEALQAARSS